MLPPRMYVGRAALIALLPGPCHDPSLPRRRLQSLRPPAATTPPSLPALKNTPVSGRRAGDKRYRQSE